MGPRLMCLPAQQPAVPWVVPSSVVAAKQFAVSNLASGSWCCNIHSHPATMCVSTNSSIFQQCSQLFCFSQFSNGQRVGVAEYSLRRLVVEAPSKLDAVADVVSQAQRPWRGLLIETRSVTTTWDLLLVSMDVGAQRRCWCASSCVGVVAVRRGQTTATTAGPVI